ncbi:carbohydrate esterase family 4 protein [Mycena vitilis]|nr:carbohydrate esterase family 4 protein [Mycena vitilis]
MYPRTLLAASALFLGVRADPTLAQQSALQDPVAECAPYNFQPITDAKANFPPISTPVAAILANDAAGQAKFNAMKGNIPNITPTGTNGDIDQTIFAGYPPADPNCWWSSTLCTVPKLAGLDPDIDDVPEPKTLGYGFDDGPNCSHNAFYDYLTSKNQKATMYFIGTNVWNEPLQAQRAVADGHEICVHTWSHRAMTALTNEQAFGELWYTMQLIKLVTGYTPTCWRPPQGDVDDRIRYIASQLGLVNILWKFDAFDWKVASGQATPAEVQANYDNLIGNATGGVFDTVGAIMLTHELDNFTMQTAIDNYDKLAAAFTHIVPVGVGHNRTQPYVENNYTQPSFSAYIAGTRSGPGSAGSSSASGSGSSPSGSAGSGSGSGAGTASKSGSGSASQSTGGSGNSSGVPLRVTGAGLLAVGLAVLAGAVVL